MTGTHLSYQTQAFEFEGIDVRYRTAGGGMSVLMLHGSGPGASTVGNWRAVLDPLARHMNVYAMDLIGFGESGRKNSPPYFDVDLWLRQCRYMIGLMPGEQIGIIGHSLSGALALKLAALEPRIGKVLTTATMGAHFPLNDATARIWTFPRDRDELRRTAEILIRDRALIDEAYLSNRESILFAGDYAEYFASMFGGNKQAFIDAVVLDESELARIRCSVCMLHGREDAAFPAEFLTLRLARALPQADVQLLARCAHSIAMEQPLKLVSAATQLFS
jgi:2-hydroxymuconate-semialdehyde hydrolase